MQAHFSFGLLETLLHREAAYQKPLPSPSKR
jgi:hypothetical protein